MLSACEGISAINGDRALIREGEQLIAHGKKLTILGQQGEMEVLKVARILETPPRDCRTFDSSSFGVRIVVGVVGRRQRGG